MKTPQAFNSAAALLAVVLAIPAAAQSPGAAAPSAVVPGLTAELVDAQAKAKQKAATVKVSVTGVRLVDPGLVKEKPRKGQGHLHYRVDNGPVVATTAAKLSFHELSPGAHKIHVALAANDHTPLGPEQTLTVTIP